LPASATRKRLTRIRRPLERTAPGVAVTHPARTNSSSISIEKLCACKTASVSSPDAVIANGGTVTHHHAVGRDHRPWYNRQRPPLFAEVLRAAKTALDPQGLLNPGVLIDP
jgi:FAD/FMN-containing dehydrogenase